MTEFLDVEGGRIAYEVAGAGPLVVLSHGMGDHRRSFRHLAPLLVDAGYRVASADMRGHGESSMDWPSFTRTDVAGDLLSLIRHLGGPAVIIGHSLSGGAATIAAAKEPELVSAIVEIGTFTRKQKLQVGGLLKVARYRRGITLLMGTSIFKSLPVWLRYLEVAYPGKPADHAEAMAELAAKLREPGRMAEFIKSTKAPLTDTGEALPKICCAALVVMGTEDPDFADPVAEGEAVVALMPAGLGTAVPVQGAGHYPHAQSPGEVAALVIPFLKEHAVA